MEEKIKALKEQMEAALGSVESKEQLVSSGRTSLERKAALRT